MSTADIAYWAARLAELERDLDAAKKLSEVNPIAAELMRARQALKQAEAKTGRAGPRPKREMPARRARRSASSATEPARP
jgi:hypothetical protein